MNVRKKWSARSQGAIPVLTTSTAFSVDGGTCTRSRRAARRRRVSFADRAGALMRPIFRLLPYAVIAAVAAAMPYAGYRLYLYVLTSPHFAAKTINVSGNVHVHRDAVLGAAGLAEGINVLSLDESDAEEALRALPWTRSAIVDGQLPDHVEVSIVERKAVAVVVEEKSWLVDEDGNVFKELDPGELDREMLVIGGVEVSRLAESGDERRIRESVGEAISLADQYRRMGLERYGRISGVDYDDVTGFTLVTEDRKRFAMGFGDTGVGAGSLLGTGGRDFASKLSRLSVILADIEQRGSRMRVVRLDDEKHPWKVAVAGTNLRFLPEAADVQRGESSKELLP